MKNLLIMLGIILLLLVLFVGLMTHVVADSNAKQFSWQLGRSTNQEERQAHTVGLGIPKTPVRV